MLKRHGNNTAHYHPHHRRNLAMRTLTRTTALLPPSRARTLKLS